MEQVYVHGIVHTLDGSPAQALAVRDGVIVAVGSLQEALSAVGPEAERIDLGGGALLPAFHDSHCHLLSTGLNALWLDLRAAASPEDIVRLGREYIQRRKPKPGEWILGFGYNHDRFPTPLLPDRHVVDGISANHPILLRRVCGHVGSANSLALKMAGVSADTRVEGGVFDVGKDGIPNGILRENALSFVQRNIPEADRARRMEAFRAAMGAMNRVGIASVSSNDTDPNGLAELWGMFSQLHAEGEQTLRVYQQVSVASEEAMEELLRQWRQGDDWFRPGCVKLMADGSLGGRTAWLRQPYSDDPATSGVQIFPDALLHRLVSMAHAAGIQAACHAIGDAALAQFIGAVETAQGEHPRQRDLRHRAVHCQIGHMGLYRRMLQAGMCADVQPPFLPTDARIAQDRLGQERTSASYLWRTLLDMGVPLAGGSDTPVEPFEPLWGIRCAVTRRDADGWPEGGWQADQRMTVEQAVRLYTLGGAYVTRQEGRLGVLRPGALADLIVLDRDVFATEPMDIDRIRVLRTVVGGETVYEA